jgi:hypothetical protein
MEELYLTLQCIFESVNVVVATYRYADDDGPMFGMDMDK